MSARSFPVDGIVVPSLLLLIARELCLFDPPRELAWQLFHELKDVPKPAWLATLLPQPAPVLYDDPVALLLAALVTGLAGAYAVAALLGARPRVRGALVAAAALALVVLPTVGFIALGLAAGRPYGHDGGVVQLPLALDRILAGQTPYGADYSGSVLGWQSRSSVFWAPLGGNPIVRHHWYLPGMHLLMALPYLLFRGLFGFFDARLVTLAAYGVAIVLVTRLLDDSDLKLAAAAIFAVNPFVYWQQIFGTNDVLSAVPLLLAAILAGRRHPDAAAAMVGVSCAVKQLAWPFAPFFLVHLAGATTFRDFANRGGLLRLLRPTLIAGAVFAAIVLPVAALDARAFVADIFSYQTGSPGSEQYPLGGTPGFGLANLLIYTGQVTTLGEYFPFQRYYLLLIPAGLLLLQYQLRNGGIPSVFVCGSAALLLSLYCSRIVNPNYLILASLLLPVGLLMDRRLPADVAVVPLLVLLAAVEVSLREPFRTTWEDAQRAGVGLGLPAWLSPDPAGPRWRDPLSTGISGALAGVALVYLFAGLVGASRRWRLGLVAAAAALAMILPTAVVSHVGAVAGLRRAQDAWYVEVLRSREAPGPGPWAQRPGYTPTPVVEAWTTSWRRDPPRPLAERPPSPMAFDLGRAMRALGLMDPRFLSVVAAALAAAFAMRFVRSEHRALAAAVVLLSPASAIGVVFGAGDAIVLAFIMGAWLLARRGILERACSLVGAVGAAAPQALLLTTLTPRDTNGPQWRRSVLFGALGFVVVALPLLILFPGELSRWVMEPRPVAPGIGLSNLLYYWPVNPTLPMAALRILAPILLVSLTAGFLRSTRALAHPLAAGGALWTMALFLLPSVSPHAAAVPIAILAIAALELD
jgi:uncharacterized membrane protein